MTGVELIAAARAQSRAALDELAGKQLLAGFGVKVPRSVTVPNAGAAAAAAGQTPPLAVKVMSPDILHKSDAGGVKIGLQNAHEVGQAIEAMAALPAIKAARIDGY